MLQKDLFKPTMYLGRVTSSPRERQMRLDNFNTINVTSILDGNRDFDSSRFILFVMGRNLGLNLQITVFKLGIRQAMTESKQWLDVSTIKPFVTHGQLFIVLDTKALVNIRA